MIIMLKSWQKTLISFSFLIVLFGGIFSLQMKPLVVKAQGYDANSVTTTTVAPSQDDSDKEMTAAFGKMTKSLFTAMAYGFIEVTSGITFEDVGNNQIVHVNGENSLIGMADKAFTVVGTLPVSGVGQVEAGLETIGLSPIQKVNAQGYGYASLEPLMAGWRIFRNIAYVFFTVIILVVGIMILFQQKFDGSLVLTVQKAIPGIILSLIMVTFSYAIVGFLIDAMYLLMFLFSGLFAGTNGLDADKLMNQNILTIGGTMMWDGVGSLWSLFGNIISGDSAKNLGNGGPGGIASFIVFDIILYGLIGGLLNFIFMIVLIIVILINIWKLFVVLLKSYVLLILNTLFAPILLMLGAIPGNQGVKKWFNAIIGNLSAFVAVFVIMVVYFFIKELGNTTAGTGHLFVPPYVVGGIADGSGINFTSVAMSILGLGIIITLPELVEKVRQKMGANSGFLGEMAKVAGGKVASSLPAAGSVIGGVGSAAALGVAKGAQRIGSYGGRVNQFGQDLQDYLQKTGLASGGTFGTAFSGGSRKGRSAISKVSNPVKGVGDYVNQRSTDREEYENFVGQVLAFKSRLENQKATNGGTLSDVLQAKLDTIDEWLSKYTQSNRPHTTGFRAWRDRGKPKAPTG